HPDLPPFPTRRSSDLVDLGLDARRAQARVQLRAQGLDVALAVGAPLVERGGDAAILLRLEVAEREILELPFQLPHAQAVGERSVDGARLERAPLAPRARQRARVTRS